MPAMAPEAHGSSREPKRRILFVCLANDIGTDRLPATLGAMGAECAVLCPPNFYCAAPRAVGRWFRMPPHRGLWLGIPFVRPRLEAACRDWGAELVVPLDNVSAQCLRVIATSDAATPYLRLLLQRSLGSPSGYHAACSRSGLMQLASDIGINLPRFRISSDPALMLRHAEEWGYPVVLKAENTCGGHGVTIAQTADELRAALAELQEGSVLRRMRRSLGRGFWRLAGLSGTTGAPPLLQSFAAGIPAMRTVSTWQGQVLAGVSFAAEQVHPAPTGPSTIVRFVENAEMEEATRRLVAGLGCSGFVSLDFMLDEPTGRAALIEINPRPIGTTHLGRLFGQDPCAPLLARLAGEPAFSVPRQASENRMIALFPKEIERDPRNLRRLRTDAVYHDVPYDEPAVMAMYLQRLRRRHPKDFATIAQAIDAMGPETRVTTEAGDRLLVPGTLMGAFVRYP
jgi:ATP-grasp domain